MSKVGDVPPGGAPPPPGYGGAPPPGYGAPPPGAPGYGAPPPGAPGYGAPPPGAPGYGAPLAPMGMPPAAPAAQRFDVPGAPAMPTAMDPSQVAQIEHLSRIPKLFVQQKIDLIEMFTGFDVSNTYEVFLSKEHKQAGARWLLAKEDSSACARLCIPRNRAFTLDVGVAHATGGGGRTLEEQLGLVDSAFVYPMVRLRRECFWCLSEVGVQDGRGQPIGSGQEICTNLFMSLPLTCCPVGWDLSIGGREYQMRGPCGATLQVCMSWPCRDPFDFVLNETASGRVVGKVSNVPNGCCKMMFTNADDYEVEFDPSATPQERGLLVAMTFAIDARFFEAKQDQKQNNHGVMMM